MKLIKIKNLCYIIYIKNLPDKYILHETLFFRPIIDLFYSGPSYKLYLTIISLNEREREKDNNAWYTIKVLIKFFI